ncbi:hypothetical protein MPSEU_000302100 [Mayamaea pseudoterrestris]|nr:hypothetical protein MPSEU_000302100 [Mayamaea pseudoterrestris]
MWRSIAEEQRIHLLSLIMSAADQDYHGHEDSDYTEESYYEEEVEDNMTPDEQHQVARFQKMCNMGVPQGAVRVKMEGEGCSQAVVEAVFGNGASGGSSRPTTSAAPAPRPAHPLFGSSDTKNALAAAAANIKTKPNNELSPSTPPAATDARAAMNEQIKAMALRKAGGSPPTLKKTVVPPSPTKTSSGNPLADQVAMLAQNRAKRMAGGGEPAVNDNDANSEAALTAPRTLAPPPKSNDSQGRVARNNNVTNAAAAASVSTPAAAPATEAPQKSGWRGGGKKKTEGAPAPAVAAVPSSTSAVVQEPARETSAPVADDGDAKHDFQKVKLTPPIHRSAAAASSTSPPTNTTTTTNDNGDTVVTTEIISSTPGGEGPTTRTVTRTTTTTTKTIKRVTKNDPEYERTVKCGCSVM